MKLVFVILSFSFSVVLVMWALDHICFSLVNDNNKEYPSLLAKIEQIVCLLIIATLIIMGMSHFLHLINVLP